jgi:hypothetical protein
MRIVFWDFNEVPPRYYARRCEQADLARQVLKGQSREMLPRLKHETWRVPALRSI